MNMTNVDSSQIHSIGHEERTSLLHVRFHSGSTYEYANVPLEKYQSLLQSDSVGKYFGREIKGNAAHPFRKIEEDKS